MTLLRNEEIISGVASRYFRGSTLVRNLLSSTLPLGVPMGRKPGPVGPWIRFHHLPNVSTVPCTQVDGTFQVLLYSVCNI
jgi:hypothetical protein